jgi:Ca-activated chloride channel family protein
VHNYDDDIVVFLQNLARYYDPRDPMNYFSAVLLQEQLVYEYNRGVYCEDERAPSEALVPFYVQDSVLPLDHPYVVLPSASPAQEEAADDFFDYLRQPAQQDRFAAIGFRSRASQFEPWALTGRVSDVLNGQEADRRTGMEQLDEQSFTPTPSGAVVQAVLESWDEVRKEANILFVLDTSLSMRERLPDGRRRYEVMQATVARGVRQLLAGPHDAGLWTFPNREGDDPPYVSHVPVGPVGDTRGDIVAAIQEDLPDPGLGTPIYRTIRDAHEHLVERSRNQDQPRPEIDAIVVVTDGGTNDPRNEDYDVDALLDDIRPQEGEPPVKVFSIAFGSDADLANLRRISDATGGEAYDARDAARLDDVFPQVINNF